MNSKIEILIMKRQTIKVIQTIKAIQTIKVIQTSRVKNKKWYKK
jgi:hypothetical protein